MGIDFAVVTATRDYLPGVTRCIEDVKKYTTGNYLHIISDDSSQLATLDYLRSVPYIHLIETKGDNNPHLPLVLRKAFKKAFELDAKYILMVESDVYVTPEWDQKLIKAIESKQPGVGGVAAVTIKEDTKKLAHPSRNDIRMPHRQAWEPGKFNIVVDGHKHLHFSCTIFNAEACKRVDFCHEDRVGGVDIRYSGELKKLGYKLYVDLGTYVYHPKSHSSRNEWKVRTGRIRGDNRRNMPRQ